MYEGFNFTFFCLFCNWVMERAQPSMVVLCIFAQTFTESVNRTSFLVLEINLSFLSVLMVIIVNHTFLVHCGEEEDKPFVDISKPLTR